MKSFFQKVLKDYKYRGNKLQVYLIVFLFLLLLIGASLFVLNYKSHLHIERERDFHAPVTSVFTAVKNTEFLSEWCPSLEKIDSINEEEIHVLYKKHKIIIRNGHFEPFRYIEKRITDDFFDKERLTVKWKLNPVNDTLTHAHVVLDGKLPFLALHWNMRKKAEQRLDKALKGLNDYLIERKKKVAFHIEEKPVQIEPTYYLYKSYPVDGNFYTHFYEDFPAILLYAISQKIYRSSIRPFLIFYPAEGDTAFHYNHFRIGIPVSQIPGELPAGYHIDSLPATTYYGVNFNGNYDYLLENIFVSEKIIPDTFQVNKNRPVLVRFNKGHNYSQDPSQWETEVLYTLRND